MSEIKTNDMLETRPPQVEQFQKIQPEKETTIEESRNFWNEVFNNGLEKAQDISTTDIITDNKDPLAGELNTRDESRIIEYRHTINESLENYRHPITGIEFERKIVEHPDGHLIEGVFPKFDSIFDAKISEDLYLENNQTHFKVCNKQLLKAIESDPDFKKKFSEEQIEQIKDGVIDGTAPDGFVWHHNEEAGVIQLVDSTIHALTGHTGGRSIWGGGYGD